MNAAQALAVVDRLTFVLQRMRSISAETLGDDATAHLLQSYLTPWVYGPKCLLPALAKVQDRGSVTPGELYNFCFIAHTLEPTIALSSSLMAVAGNYAAALPAPSADWLTHPWA
jgi:hypothetical protein